MESRWVQGMMIVMVVVVFVPLGAVTVCQADDRAFEIELTYSTDDELCRFAEERYYEWVYSDQQISVGEHWSDVDDGVEWSQVSILNNCSNLCSKTIEIYGESSEEALDVCLVPSRSIVIDIDNDGADEVLWGSDRLRPEECDGIGIYDGGREIESIAWMTTKELNENSTEFISRPYNPSCGAVTDEFQSVLSPGIYLLKVGTLRFDNRNYLYIWGVGGFFNVVEVNEDNSLDCACFFRRTSFGH